jgi:hypothetical protein
MTRPTRLVPFFVVFFFFFFFLESQRVCVWGDKGMNWMERTKHKKRGRVRVCVYKGKSNKELYEVVVRENIYGAWVFLFGYPEDSLTCQNMQCTCKRVPHSSGLHLMGQHVVASLASAWPCVGEFFLLFIARSFGFWVLENLKLCFGWYVGFFKIRIRI